MNEQKQYKFEGVAVKCDTWEQMEHLSKIAKELGLEVKMMVKACLESQPYFRKSIMGYYTHHSEIAISDNEIIVPYSNFIAQSEPTPSVEQLTASWNC